MAKQSDRKDEHMLSADSVGVQDSVLSADSVGVQRRVAVCPLTADPPTLAHQAIVARALTLFDELFWAIGTNPAKHPMFSVEERLGMLQAIVEAEGWQGRVKPVVYQGGTARFALSQGVGVLVRGLRSPIDFTHEYAQTVANRDIGEGVETVFLMTTPTHMACSSSLVRELLLLGESIEAYVPKVVLAYIQERVRPE